MTTAQIDPTQDQKWGRVLQRLHDELGEEVYSSWFTRIDFESRSASVVKVSVPTLFIRQWVEQRYGARIVQLCQQEMGDIRRVDFVVRGSVRPGSPSAPGRADKPSQPSPERAPRGSAKGTSAKAPKTEPDQPEDALNGSPLDPRYTLSSFEEGPSNMLALAAAKRVAVAASGEKAAFNPLFIHGSVGYGKTHILQGIAAEARQHAQRRVLYLTAEHYIYRFVAALKNQTALAFKELLRDIDVLLIDDLQFLHGGKVQEEFCHTLNALVDGARQVVLAADRPVSELEGLDQRVRSRIGAGLSVEIGAPDLELRSKILERRLAAQKAAFPELEFPRDVLDFVARSVTSNGRDLDGAVNRLVARNQLTGAAITLDMAESALKDLVRAREGRRPKIEDIQRVVAQHYNVSKADLVSARRTRAVVRPRQVAMFLAKSLTPRSLPEIGRRFGGRDHTTVLHAVRKIDSLVGTDNALAEDVETLKRLLDS
ncbi:chromosomal replication initiator protein DnaA [Amorphus orientalis]|uniref:Chromosomal replication initiator protein DnaA n=1 Tax=Amorphus orientalis TaxID=649198 RepID=A0AAE4ARG1_9HYPH|nr:chromosomal replication initiator protein DnaA [Amorphus orientalis]MDQ0314172.1 chromosomal replication initiator protein [Amorphus orientalis]